MNTESIISICLGILSIILAILSIFFVFYFEKKLPKKNLRKEMKNVLNDINTLEKKIELLKNEKKCLDTKFISFNCLIEVMNNKINNTIFFIFVLL